MALQQLRASARAPVGARRSVACCAMPRPVQAVGQQAAAVLAAAALTLGGASPAMAAEFNSLADIVRPQFAFVDENKDGVISKQELLRTSKQVAEDVDFLIPEESQIDFAMKLFDLNQDGTLTTDELLASIALDGAVSDDSLDADVVKVFDRDNDGFVTLREFKNGVPPLGPNGEAAKEYIFTRVDQVVDGNSKLDTQEFANALVLMRAAILGY